MEGLCPNISSIWINHGQVAAVGFPPTPSPDPGLQGSYTSLQAHIFQNRPNHRENSPSTMSLGGGKGELGLGIGRSCSRL
ncbi:hypothetical protein F7725_000298 [Dissostichus mawsoni]|uniref:Uncharacterized protein n=1 Tax=Dissostichus mawsoni TaxID=36200 RepID=A0A7J5ZEM2_DISMA|nr:hypothetical protein F7725_000298 [Dissostichus mawsoni]